MEQTIKRATQAVDYDPFAGAPVTRVVPTTEPQREMWLADQLGPEASLAFNESVSLRLRGPLDLQRLHASLQALLNRHSALRSNLGPDGQTLCVLDQVTMELPLHDVSALPSHQRDTALRQRQELAVSTPFDLQHDRLLRAELARLAIDDHTLLLTAHHVVCDGWSWWVLVRELGALYAAHGDAAAAALAPAEDFADYAMAQAAGDGAALRSDEAYWLARFADGAPVLDLPTDRPRPSQRGFAAARADVVLDADLVESLRRFGAARGASLFATLLASFGGLLARLAGQPQVVVGIPAAGQALDDHDGLVGHCVNTLPLLLEPDLARPAGALIDAAQITLLDALDHQRFTFGTLLRKLKLARDPARLPLISVMFNIDQAIAQQDHAFPGLELSFTSNPRCCENFELFVNAVQEHGQLRLECQYQTALFDDATVRRWMGHWQTLLRAMVTEHETAFGQLPLLAETERRQLLEKFNDTRVVYPTDVLLHELIENQVADTPEAIAVVHEADTLSYVALNVQANRLAHHLRALGVQPDDRVAVCAERGLDLMVALLAVLKSGAGYVPLDPHYPPERLAMMLADCTPVALLTQQALAGKLEPLAPNVPMLQLDAPRPAWSTQPGSNPERVFDASERQLAYVIYTSGSTGTPKGAMNEHRGVVNRLLWMAHTYPLQPGEAVLQKTPVSFDVSVWELFLPLMTGARLVMARAEGHKDPAYLASAIRTYDVSLVHFVPSMLQSFLDLAERDVRVVEQCLNLRHVICSGEALPASLAQRFARLLPEVQLHNLYGPTEAAVDVTYWPCGQLPDNAASVPIGRPVANTRMYVLDGQGQPAPVGVRGELFIGGVQVGRGYLNRPELTAERFVADPFVGDAGARMYRTGDLGRWSLDGHIDYLGRIDDQLKLRGVRIEPGEIEQQLMAQPSVAAAAVMAREDRPGDVRLVAYVVGRANATLDSSALSAALRQHLPEAMIPQHIVRLDALPLSPNGKLDRRALPAPVAIASANSPAPRGALETQVHAAMMSALGTTELGIDDNFFEMGGHSLLAAQLIARLNRELGRQLSLRTVFDAPTVARLAAALAEDSPQSHNSALPTTLPRRADRLLAPLSLQQQRVWYLEQLQPGRVVYNTPSAHRLIGDLDEAAFQRALQAMVDHQPSLRTAIVLLDEQPQQRIEPNLLYTLLPAEDLSALSPARREAQLQRRMEALTAEPFALDQAPLFRARLYRLGPSEYVFYFMTHHVIWDGWSFDLLYRELAQAYGDATSGNASSLTPLAIDYGDYAAAQRAAQDGDALKAQVAYWQQRLANPPAPLELPADRPRPPRMSGEGATEWIQLSPAQAAALRQLGQGKSATLFMVLLALYVALLQRLSGQSDLVISTPVRGRDRAELEPVMGFFVNALPLRIQADPAAPFAQLLGKVREAVLDAFAHADVPFEQVVRTLKLPRDDSRPPLAQAMFSFQDVRDRPTQWGDLQQERILLFQRGAADDLGLWFVEDEQGLAGGLTYNTDLFDADTAVRFRDRYLALLISVLDDPQQPLASLNLLPDAEQAQMAQWQQGDTSAPLGGCIHELVQAQARRTPERIALRSGGNALSYAALDARANRIAHALRQRGAGPGVRVGLALERHADLLASLLAVLKTGAAYVPLDPAYPRDRLALMVEDAGLGLLVTERALAKRFDASATNPVWLINEAGDELAALPDTPMPEAIDPQSPAYVIYTSGSTGRPKGVVIAHRSAVNFLNAMTRRPGLTANDALVAITTLSFDIAVLELLAPLCVGAQVVLATREQAMDGEQLCALLQYSGATVMQATPATWRILLQAGWAGHSNFRALCGGEPLAADLARQLLDRCGQVWNLYGPTETTVWSTCWRVEHPEQGIRIGTPIDHTSVHVLDPHGQPCPVGVPGELWIGGQGVALEYLHRPKLTAERFTADTNSQSSIPGGDLHPRLYRTGDRARWLADGRLAHLGRLDFQVKLRGFRIELGEIEALARMQPTVTDAVAIVHEFSPTDRRLLLYVATAHAQEVVLPLLRDALAAQLPRYMLPQHLLALPALPQTPNGKIDRRALPLPAAEALTVAPAAVEDGAPAAILDAFDDDRQRYLARVWCDLIGVSQVRSGDNFFDLGGHSLLAVDLAARVQRDTGVRLNLLAIATGSLASLARELPETAAQTPARKRWGAGLRGLLGLR